MVMVQCVSPLSRSAGTTQVAGSPQSSRRSTASKSLDLKAKTLELLQKYEQTRSAAIRNRLVEMNLGLVRKEAHHWKHQCQESFDDLLQIGCIGLIQSIERFDVSRGMAFSSFAMPYIRGEIQHYLRDKSPTVRLPRKWSALFQRHKKAVAHLRQELGRTPRDNEVREAMELTFEEWEQFKVAKQNRATISLDAPVRHADNEGSSLGDLVPDARYQSFQLAQEDRIRLVQAMSNLEERTRQILEFVFLQDLSQKETAAHLNISAVTVSRQVKKGLRQLNQLLAQEEAC